MSDERFGRATVDTLAKRAGSMCSNPECGALTVGPAGEQNRAVVVGEAAHIYGARAGSARFDTGMSDAERSDVTNGIWLCRNCHKLIDADANQYPADLLFEWRRDHERTILSRLGRAGALRQQVIDRRLEGFEGCSYLAQQIIIDKPPLWELKLTAEIMRNQLSPVIRRWESLQGGLYALHYIRVSKEDCASWFSTCLKDGQSQAQALNGLMNGAIQDAWGVGSQPGSEHKILQVCTLISKACERIVEIEERIKFAIVDDIFGEIHALMTGIYGPNIVRISEVPAWLSGVISKGPIEGGHHLMVEFNLTDGWGERFDAATDRAIRLM